MGCEIIIKKGSKEVKLTSLELLNEEDFASAVVQNGLTEFESSQIKNLLAEENPVSIKIVKDGSIETVLPNYTVDQFIKQYNLEEDTRLKALTDWLYTSGRMPRIYMSSVKLETSTGASIRGALLSNRNVILLDGTKDKNAIVNTLVHELTHQLFDESFSKEKRTKLVQLITEGWDAADGTLGKQLTDTYTFVKERYFDNDLNRELLAFFMENPAFLGYVKKEIDKSNLEDIVEFRNEVKFYTPNHEEFTLYINGKAINKTPSDEVKLEKIFVNTLNVKIVFNDSTIQIIEKKQLQLTNALPDDMNCRYQTIYRIV